MPPPTYIILKILFMYRVKLSMSNIHFKYLLLFYIIFVFNNEKKKIIIMLRKKYFGIAF